MMLFALSAGAQSLKQDVISSAGGYNVASGGAVSISWTLGETIIPTFTSKDGSLIITNGFQQKIVITTLVENITDPSSVTVYPNPAIDAINIKFNIPSAMEITYFLLNNQGGVVKTGTIEAATANKDINIQELPSGIYYLRLIKGNLVNVYKVVKL
jgi:acid phosphatase type 7